MLPLDAWIRVFVAGSKFASLLFASHCGVAISYLIPALMVSVGESLKSSWKYMKLKRCRRLTMVKFVSEYEDWFPNRKSARFEASVSCAVVVLPAAVSGVATDAAP